MRIKSGFIIREIAGSPVIIPIGERVIDYKGMMLPNETGAFLWRELQNETTFERLLQSMLDAYDVEEATASADIEEFLNELRSVGALEE
jgi:hypothetical protein